MKLNIHIMYILLQNSNTINAIELQNVQKKIKAPNFAFVPLLFQAAPYTWNGSFRKVCYIPSYFKMHLYNRPHP